MNTNIDLSGLDNHFFSENSQDSLDNNTASIKTKITKYNFYSVNEAQISDKIRILPNYYKKFNIIEDYEFVNISQLNEERIEKLNLDNKMRYLTFNYKNVPFIDFNTYLFKFKNIKTFIFAIIESFSYLLDSLQVLNDNNICFFNLCPENIGSLDYPIIQNFQYSLQLSRLNESYFTNIIHELDDHYIYKPLEVHVLFYLIKNDLNTISYSFIEEICEIYVQNLTVLQFFNPNYVKTYKKSCIESLKIYINKNKGEIINDLLENVNTWDIFSLSVLYLHIIGNIMRTFSLQGTFISKIFMELSNNIQPNFIKRHDLESMREIFNKLFNEENSWNYINGLKNGKFGEFIANLQK